MGRHRPDPVDAAQGVPPLRGRPQAASTVTPARISGVLGHRTGTAHVDCLPPLLHDEQMEG